MKILKNITIVLLISILVIQLLTPSAMALEEIGIVGEGTQGLSAEQQGYLSAYVRAYYSQTVEYYGTYGTAAHDYDIGGSHRQFYHQNDEEELDQSDLRLMKVSCASLCAGLLHQALDVDIWDSKTGRGGNIRGTGFFNPRGGNFNSIQENEYLQPGDVLVGSGYRWHAMLYIGMDADGNHQIIQTDGSQYVFGIDNMVGCSQYKGQPITLAMARNAGGKVNCEGTLIDRYGVASRLKPELLDKNWEPEKPKIIRWPNGVISTWDGEFDAIMQLDTSGFLYYSGIPGQVGSLGVTENGGILSIIDVFLDIMDYLVGIVTYIVRIPFIGIANVAQSFATQSLEVISTQPVEETLTLEKIVLNQVPIFDVNIFNTNEAGGESLTTNENAGNIILTLRQNVASWYNAFRYFVIALLLVILIYLGIRMAITSIAEEKAQYKRLLKDWFISFFIVMFIHYFIVIIMQLNDYFVNVFTNIIESSDMGSFYDSVLIMAYDFRFTEGWYGTILYIALVWYMLKYAWKYIKRLLSVLILIILSPLVAVSYALDKIRDNRSQSLGKWLKEIAFTILIQSVHALIYTVFIAGIISQIVVDTNILNMIGACVFLLIAIKFMDAVEDIFENIFGFKSSDALKEVMDSTIGLVATYKLAARWVKRGVGLAKGSVKATRSIGKNLIVQPMAEGIKQIGAKNSKIGNLLESIEDIKTGYRENKYGMELDDSKTYSNINSIIRTEENKPKNAFNTSKKHAEKALNTARNTALNFGKGIGLFITNPLASISYLIAAGAAARVFMKTTTIKGYNRNVKKSFKTKNKGKIRLLDAQRKKEMGLRQSINDLYESNNGILNSTYINSHLVEIPDVESLHDTDKNMEKRKKTNSQDYIEKWRKTINDKLAQASKIIKKDEVSKAVNAEVLNNTSNKKTNLNIDTVRKVANTIENGDANVKTNKRNLVNNFKQELQNAIINRASEDTETIKFGKQIPREIEQKAIKLKAEAKEQRLKGKEKDKYIKDGLEAVTRRYLSDKKNFNNVMKSLDTDDFTNLMTRAINKEGSIKRDYNIEIDGQKIDVFKQNTNQDINQKREKIRADLKNILRKTIEVREGYVDAVNRTDNTIIDLSENMRI